MLARSLAPPEFALVRMAVSKITGTFWDHSYLIFSSFSVVLNLFTPNYFIIFRYSSVFLSPFYFRDRIFSIFLKIHLIFIFGICPQVLAGRARFARSTFVFLA